MRKRARPSGGGETKRAEWSPAALEAAGVILLRRGEPGFPPRLTEIPDPPAQLFLKGEPALLQRPAVAIVGSREHSRYGAEVAAALGRAAAGAGLVVVSGMARGLDAVAHQGALAAGGATIGVLGNGLGYIYPASNRLLYAEVGARGLLLTELPPGVSPHPGSFPQRNRLISGLARVTVVVEAASQSGALQTAGCALAQGREVMAVPGPITSVVSAGTNQLIRDGAAPLLELADLLSHYPELARPAVAAAADRSPETQLARRMLNALLVEPLTAEQLVEASEAPVEAALDSLSLLELEGRVRQEAGGLYRAVPQLF